jgi:hypothetical protein
MNRIKKDELFTHVSAFLKTRGIELQSGGYTTAIEKGCQVLADTINLSQQALERAKTGIEQNLDKAREIIHEKTAPRKPPVQRPPGPEPTAPSAAAEPPKTLRSRRPKAGSAKGRRKGPK